MSRSPVTCPRCGAPLADRRRKGSVAIRPDVEMLRLKGEPHTLRLTCPSCNCTVDWLLVKIVVFELMTA